MFAGALGQFALGEFTDLYTEAVLSVVEAQDGSAITAGVTAAAQLLVEEQQDTAEFIAGVDVNNAALVVTEAQDTSSITAAVRAAAQLIVAEAPDTASVTASVVAFLELAVTEGRDTAQMRAFAADFYSGDGEVACVREEIKDMYLQGEHRYIRVPPPNVRSPVPGENTTANVEPRRRTC